MVSSLWEVLLTHNPEENNYAMDTMGEQCCALNGLRRLVNKNEADKKQTTPAYCNLMHKIVI